MTDTAIKNSGDLQDQIRAAIGVHGLWKSRIMQACQTGKSEWDPATVAPSGNCDFGKWLNGMAITEKNEHYKKVFDLHAQFHKEAARVLRLALSGKTAEAQGALKLGGDYANLTANLTNSMMAWSKAAQG